jgi:hypothetical protein
MENKSVIGITLVVLVVIAVLIYYYKKEHYDGGLQTWNWTSLKNMDTVPRNKCIAKPGKYFTPRS